MSAEATLAASRSYADALTHAIARAFLYDDLIGHFRRRSHNLDALTGRHTLTYELAGTGKTYRVMIEPIAETHRVLPPRQAEETLP